MTAAADTTVRLLKILRPRLRLLAAGAEIPLDADLGRLGLDSLESIDLLMDIEAEFGAPVPDEKITVETFATAANLLRVIEEAAG
ncbi:MAG TPA: phosphopantetheine-binding protein [Prosthecobacter sp.]|nr:phosphopantetheine-binding protein [Prosthecobacter sp.]HRK15424.1 phosphopantetheine-binding protein [Prosthecobacter sp.]